MIYKAEYIDDEMEVYQDETDLEALTEGYSMEKQHGHLISIFELDEDYNEIRTIF